MLYFVIGLILMIVFFVGRKGGAGSIQSNYIEVDKNRLKKVIDEINLSNENPVIASKVKRFSKEFDVNPWIIMGIIHQESDFVTDAKGSIGEKGLMQIREGALQDVVNKTNFNEGYHPEYLDQIGYNIKAGLLYYKLHLKNTNGNIRKALAQYNGGYENPNFEYANNVLENINYLKSLY